MDDLFISKESMIYVPKGWGYELWIYNGEKYCGKILHLQPEKRSSFHFHVIKDEVLYLDSGLVVIKYSHQDDINLAEQRVLHPGEAFHVQPGLRHQIICLEHPSDIFEFSTHHEDSDSIRIAKGD